MWSRDGMELVWRCFRDGILMAQRWPGHGLEVLRVLRVLSVLRVLRVLRVLKVLRVLRPRIEQIPNEIMYW